MVARAGRHLERFDRRERRLFLGGAAFLLLALGLLAWALRPQASEQRPEPPSTRIEGLRASLVDRETAIPGGFAWTTRWRLCWRPVAGATSYLVTIVTSEGVDPVPRQISKACHALAVANGTADERGERPGRNAQLALMKVMLSVSVAARFADGANGPWSPDFAVGAPYR